MNDTTKFFMFFMACLIGGYIIAHPIAYITGALDDSIEVDRRPAWTK